MVENHPADPLLRWMMAIQCRSRGDNEKGVVHFAKLLEQWSPGPVLVHQTYANLLDNLDQYEEARKAPPACGTHGARVVEL